MIKMAETIPQPSSSSSSSQVAENGHDIKKDERTMNFYVGESRKEPTFKGDSIHAQGLLNGRQENGEDNKEKEDIKLPCLTSKTIADGSLEGSYLFTNTEHMVQNQMTPTYQYAQTGLEDYHHQVVSQASTVTADPTTQYKEQTAVYTAPANGGVEQQTQTDLDGEVPATTVTPVTSASQINTGPKRLHVSNIPFRFREADLRNLLGGFGFVTFQNSADADRAREKLNGTVVEGRKIEVNNATARVMTKKAANPTIPNAAALRGVALTRGRAAAVAARGAYTAAAAAAAAAAFRHPTPLAPAATALPYTASVYQDPFLAATYAAADRYQLVTTQPYAAAGYAAATRYAIPAVATAATYAAGYGREYAADPYLGHSIGPVAGYGATVYRGGYQRFAPY